MKEGDLTGVYAGCGALWVTDVIWKENFPHCMYCAEILVPFPQEHYIIYKKKKIHSK